MKFGLIYKITSKTSKKSYIGQTINYHTRIKKHKMETSNTNTHFGRAIRKYGWKDFIVEVVEDNLPLEILDEREKYWINYFDTVNNGYNSTYGAKGGNTYCKKSKQEMDEIKAKISIANSGDRNGNKGQYVGSKNSMYGKHHTKETKQKLSVAMKGRKDSYETRLKKSLSLKGKPKNYYHPNRMLYVIQDNEVIKMKARDVKELLGLDDYKHLKMVVHNKIVVNGYLVVEGVETTENIA